MIAFVLIALILVWYATYKLGFYIQPSLGHPANALGRIAWALIGVPLLWFFLLMIFAAILMVVKGTPNVY